MTQAFNLSQLANNLNTSGQLDATDGLTGAVPVANGGTGLTAVGTSGNVLTSNGSVWTSTAPASPTIADGSITDPKISNGVAVGTTYYPIVGQASSNNIANSSLQKILSFRCTRGGTFNIRFKVANFSGVTATLGTRIYVNGVAVGSTISGSLAHLGSRTDTHTSITVTRDQVVDIYGSNNVDASGATYIATPQIGTSGSTSMMPFTTACISASGLIESLPI